MAEQSEAVVSAPERLGRQSRQTLGIAQAKANKELGGLREKTNTIFQKAQGGLDDFVEAVYSAKNKTVLGIDTAIGLIEVPLMGLAPLLRETANAGISTVFATVETIPETVVAQVDAIKGPLIEQVEIQVANVATAAEGQITAIESQVGQIKDDILASADAQLADLTDQVQTMGGQVSETLKAVIARVMERFTEIYAGKPLFEEIKAQLQTSLDALEASLSSNLNQVIVDSTKRVETVKDEAISAVHVSFEELFVTVRALPGQVKDTVRGVVARVNEAVDQTLIEAKDRAEALAADLKERLQGAADLISGAIEKIVSDGFELLRSLRDELVGSVNKVLDSIRIFCQDTIDKVQNSINEIFVSTQEKLGKGFELAYKQVDVAVDAMGMALNTQISVAQTAMKVEAGIYGLQLKAEGVKAQAQAAAKFVSNGYKEDTTAIPKIRKKGDEAIDKMSTSMEKAISALEKQFDTLVDAAKPGIEAQGKALVMAAKGTVVAVIMKCVQLAPEILGDIVSTTKTIKDELGNISDLVTGGISEKGKAYLDTCETQLMEVVETLKTTATEFAETSKTSVETLVSETKTRFEGVAEGIAGDVTQMVDSVGSTISTTATNTRDRFTRLYEDTKTAVVDTATQTKDAAEAFAADADRILEEALAAAEELVRKLLRELIEKGLDEVKARVGKYLAQLERRYMPRIEAAAADLLAKGEQLGLTQGNLDRIEAEATEVIDGLMATLAEKQSALVDVFDQLETARVGVEITVEQDIALKDLVASHYGMADTPEFFMRVWRDPRNAHLRDRQSERNQNIPDAYRHMRASTGYLCADRSAIAAEPVVFEEFATFGENATMLDEAEASKLAPLADRLKSLPHVTEIEVLGFFDAAAGETERTAELRASAARVALIRNGIMPDRLVAKSGGGDTAGVGGRMVTFAVGTIDETYAKWTADTVWVQDLSTLDALGPMSKSLTREVEQLRKGIKTAQERALNLVKGQCVAQDGLLGGFTGCLQSAYAGALTEGREKMLAMQTRVEEAFAAMTADAEKDLSTAAKEFGALREEITAELREHVTQVEAEIIEDHTVQLDDTKAVMEGIRLKIEHYFGSFSELFEEFPDPQALLTKLKDEFIPEMEAYVAGIFDRLMDCYSDRMQGAHPALADTMTMVVDVIEGRRPLGAAAVQLLKEQLLPQLQERAEALVSGVEGPLAEQAEAAQLAAAEATTVAMDAAKQTAASVTENIGLMSDEAASVVKKAASEAKGALEQGFKGVRIAADEKINVASAVDEIKQAAKGQLKEGLSEISAMTADLDAVSDKAATALEGTTEKANAGAADTADLVATADEELAGASQLPALLEEAGEELNKLPEKAVDAVREAGEQAKKSLQEAKAIAVGGGEDEAGGEEDAGEDDAGAEDEAATDEAAGDEEAAAADEAGEDAEAAAADAADEADAPDADEADADEGTETSESAEDEAEMPDAEAASDDAEVEVPETDSDDAGLDIPETGEDEAEAELEIPEAGDDDAGPETPSAPATEEVPEGATAGAASEEGAPASATAEAQPEAPEVSADSASAPTPAADPAPAPTATTPEEAAPPPTAPEAVATPAPEASAAPSETESSSSPAPAEADRGPAAGEDPLLESLYEGKQRVARARTDTETRVEEKRMAFIRADADPAELNALVEARMEALADFEAQFDGQIAEMEQATEAGEPRTEEDEQAIGDVRDQANLELERTQETFYSELDALVPDGGHGPEGDGGGAPAPEGDSEAEEAARRFRQRRAEQLETVQSTLRAVATAKTRATGRVDEGKMTATRANADSAEVERVGAEQATRLSDLQTALDALVKQTEEATDDAALEACEAERVEHETALTEALDTFKGEMDAAIADIEPASTREQPTGEGTGGGESPAPTADGTQSEDTSSADAEDAAAASETEGTPTQQEISAVTDGINAHIRTVGQAKTRSEGDVNAAKMALMKESRPTDDVDALLAERVTALDAHTAALEGHLQTASSAESPDALDEARTAADSVMSRLEEETAGFAEALAAAQVPAEESAGPTDQERADAGDAIKAQIREIGGVKTRSSGDAEAAKMVLMKANRETTAVDTLLDARVAALTAHVDALQVQADAAAAAASHDALDAASAAAQEVMVTVAAETETFEADLAAAQAPEEAGTDPKPSADEIAEVVAHLKGQIRAIQTARTRANGDADQTKMSLIKAGVPTDDLEGLRDGWIEALAAHGDAMEGFVQSAEAAESVSALDAVKGSADELMETIESEKAAFEADLGALVSSPEE